MTDAVSHQPCWFLQKTANPRTDNGHSGDATVCRNISDELQLLSEIASACPLTSNDPKLSIRRHRCVLGNIWIRDLRECTLYARFPKATSVDRFQFFRDARPPRYLSFCLRCRVSKAFNQWLSDFLPRKRKDGRGLLTGLSSGDFSPSILRVPRIQTIPVHKTHGNFGVAGLFADDLPPLWKLSYSWKRRVWTLKATRRGEHFLGSSRMDSHAICGWCLCARYKIIRIWGFWWLINIKGVGKELIVLSMEGLLW